MDAMQAELEVLKRAFARRTEKMGKMPKVPRPPRTPAEIAERRTEQALLRAEKVVTEEKPPEPVPEALKKCHLCGGTNFRSVGTGKPSEIWSYVPGYFRREIRTREVVACRCGGCVDHCARARAVVREDALRRELRRAPRRLEVPRRHAALPARAVVRAARDAHRAQHDERPLSPRRTEARAAACAALRRDQEGLPRPRRRDVLHDDEADVEGVHLGLRRSEPHRIYVRAHARRRRPCRGPRRFDGRLSLRRLPRL